MAESKERYDPREEARDYIEKNKINKLFEELGTALLFHKPNDPKAFLIKQLQAIKAKKDEAASTSIFNEVDLRAIYGMYDWEKKGSITGEQYAQALGNLGCADAAAPGDSVDLETFVASAKAELKKNSC